MNECLNERIPFLYLMTEPRTFHLIFFKMKYAWKIKVTLKYTIAYFQGKIKLNEVHRKKEKEKKNKG